MPKKRATVTIFFWKLAATQCQRIRHGDCEASALFFRLHKMNVKTCGKMGE